MGRQTSDQAQLFYEFCLEDRVPDNHLLRRINGFVAATPAGLHDELAPFYSYTGRSSIDPELMFRMLIVGYSYGIRSQRRLCEEVALNLAYVAEHLYFDSVSNFFRSRLFGLTPGLHGGGAPAPVAFRS